MNRKLLMDLAELFWRESLYAAGVGMFSDARQPPSEDDLREADRLEAIGNQLEAHAVALWKKGER